MMGYLLHRVHHFDINKYELSKLGRRKKVAIIFDGTLLLYAFLEVIFIILLLTSFQAFDHLEFSFYFFAAIIFGGLCAVFTTKTNPQMHTFFAGITIICSIIGALVFGTYLLQVNSALAIAQLILDVLVISVVLKMFIKTHTLVGKYEFVFFTGIFLWNCLNTIPLLLK